MPEPTNPDKILWCDIETTGLDSRDDFILEVGLLLSDLQGNVLARTSTPIYYPDVDWMRGRTSDYVRDMHDNNGLWRDCEDPTRSLKIWQADTVLSGWMDMRSLGGIIMAGNSLRLDRNFIDYQMPKLGEAFHYRSIDNSSTKELCRRLAPAVYEKRPHVDEKTHRVDVCLDGSITEYKFYYDNLLKVEM